MVAQKGKDMLLKLDKDGVGIFETIAGLRANTLRFNSQSVDVTDSQSSGRWRELLENAGLKSAVITGAGIFKDKPSDGFIRGQFFSGLISNWQVVVPDFGNIEGLFQIVSLEYSGRHDSELGFDLELQSAGQLNFQALV